MNSRAVLLGLLIVGPSGLLPANSQRATSASGARPATTDAKVPPTLLRARTAFLINEPPGRDTDPAFRELRAQLHKWNRFEVVDRADRADVTISLSTSQVERGAVGSGAPTGAGFVNPAKSPTVRSNFLTLTVRQRATGVILWTGGSGTVTSALQRLQQDMPRGPTLCVAFWCW
jgi:hypothetical protein